MAVLVTGASGFIGSVLVQRLLARGHAEVRALVRRGSHRARLDRLATLGGRQAQIVEGGLGSRSQAAEAIDSVSTVFHLAATLRGAPADMVLNTVVASRNLLDAALDRPSPPKIVLVSSFSVYGVAGLRRGQVVDERTPLEPEPARRDAYAQVKLWQERLFWERRLERPYALVVVRPGVVYGPGGPPLSVRVGLQLPFVYLHLGGENLLPLSYVENCAEAIALCGEREEAVGEAVNVHDDELPTARAFLARHRAELGGLRTLSVPYPVTLLGSHLVSWYHGYSRGQLPAFVTPYKVASAWKGTRFDNRRLRSLGWQPLVSTEEGLRRTFAHARAEQRP
jgi:nucleoside-diphosphate-sugar epimerase